MNYPPSFLSSYAQSLLTQLGCVGYTENNAAEESSPIVNFDLLDPCVISALSNHCYVTALNGLRIPIQRCYAALRDLSPHHLYRQYSHLLTWLSDLAEFLALYERLPHSTASEKLLIVVRLVSLLEFSLGRLYWKPESHCANTMKDLLLSPELEGLLGYNCILVLQLLFGPVNSMNLRNLFWHGFISPCDIEKMGSEIFYFLFSVVLSVGNQLYGKTFQTSRPSRLSIFLQQQQQLHAVSVNSYPTSSLMDVIRSPRLRSNPCLPYFELVDQLFAANPVPYLDALCATLICLSIILRYEFAVSFDWTDGQCTSEERFFVTLDSILDFKAIHLVPHPVLVTDFERFSNSVGKHALAVLCDVLSAEHGPRIRDRLSHGELWLNRTVNISTDQCVFESVEQYFKESSLLMRACLLSILTSTQKDHPYPCDVSQWLTVYAPSFHPLGVFQARLNQMRSYFSEIHLVPDSSSVDVPSNWSLQLWFSSTECDSLTLSEFNVVDHLWCILSAWSLIPAGISQGHWSARPTAILHRFNLILSKNLDLLKAIIEIVRRFSQTTSLSVRKLASKDRFELSVRYLREYFRWLIGLATLMWFYWLGGKGLTVAEKLELLSPSDSQIKMRAKLIVQLDRTSDKLLMWTNKSKWDSINTFFESSPSPFV